MQAQHNLCNNVTHCKIVLELAQKLLPEPVGQPLVLQDSQGWSEHREQWGEASVQVFWGEQPP